MGKGLWNRFKFAVQHIICGSIRFSKEMNVMDDGYMPPGLQRITYRIEFDTIAEKDKGFLVLLRWLRIKVKQAAMENYE